jgi:predicted membrane protein
MNKKKILFDLAFIVIATAILIVIVESGLIEKHIGFALIPILIAYYLGQFVERKTRIKSEKHSDG